MEDWFEKFHTSKEYEFLTQRPIAYFCSEFALLNNLPTYAGGLGVLAGDFIKEAARQEMPAIGVGLLYHQIYFQSENLCRLNTPKINPQKFNLTLVLDKNSQRLLVPVPIENRLVYAQAWCYRDKNTPVYLLDTNIPENTPFDRQITNRLYTADKETRIKQEMILGIGGYRLLKSLSYKPALFHLNEGHPAFLVFELIKEIMEQNGKNFSEAGEIAKSQVVYTNHTLAYAGQGIYDQDLVSTILIGYIRESKISLGDLLKHGSTSDPDSFSLTMVALRTAGIANAVSQNHLQQAAKIWPNYPLQKITNGIFPPFWDKLQPQSENDFQKNHLRNKEKLLKIIKEEKNRSIFPETLLLGWARRLVPSKRPLALLENPDRLKQIAARAKVPLKIILSGLNHQGDVEGLKLYRQILKIIKERLNEEVIFLPNYNLEIAQAMVSGVDVWVNTPVVGTEACGTSGMKASLNGVLPLTTNDGWAAEVKIEEMGWQADNEHINDSLLTIIEKEIVPLYVNHLQNPTSSQWYLKMKKNRETTTELFSTKRMLKEYFEKLYLPLLTPKL